MSIRPWRDIQRKKTKKIKVGDVLWEEMLPYPFNL